MASLIWKVFDNSQVSGDVTTEFRCLKQVNCDEIFLDTKNIAVQDVLVLDGAELKEWRVQEGKGRELYGKRLRITLKESVEYNQTVVVQVGITISIDLEVDLARKGDTGAGGGGP